MDFTLKNLKDIDDAAEKFGIGELQEARFPDADFGAQATGFSYHLVKPDKRQGFGHRHEDAEEVYVVLSGGGRARLDDEIVEVKPLDALRVAPQVMRAFEAGPDGLELLAFGPRHQGDGQLDHDFWTD